MKTLATTELEKSALSGMKWPNLESWSATTKITEYPLEKSNPIIDSMERSSQIC